VQSFVTVLSCNKSFSVYWLYCADVLVYLLKQRV